MIDADEALDDASIELVRSLPGQTLPDHGVWAFTVHRTRGLSETAELKPGLYRTGRFRWTGVVHEGLEYAARPEATTWHATAVSVRHADDSLERQGAKGEYYVRLANEELQRNPDSVTGLAVKIALDHANGRYYECIQTERRLHELLVVAPRKGRSSFPTQAGAAVDRYTTWILSAIALEDDELVREALAASEAAGQQRDPRVLAALGAWAAKQGRGMEAIRILEEALHIRENPGGYVIGFEQPDDASQPHRLHEFLAQLYDQIGDVRSAGSHRRGFSGGWLAEAFANVMEP